MGTEMWSDKNSFRQHRQVALAQNLLRWTLMDNLTESSLSTVPKVRQTNIGHVFCFSNNVSEHLLMAQYNNSIHTEGTEGPGWMK